MLRALGLIVLFISLAACTVKTPNRATVTLPNGVQVQTSTSGNPGDGNFCPPGQAKKGRC